MRTNTRLIELVEVALGNRLEADLGAITPAERVRLEHLRELASTLKLPWHVAPAELTACAKQICPEVRRPVCMASLLNRDLGFAGARSGHPDSAHFVYELDNRRARIMVEQEGQAWRVFGRVEGADWTAELQGQAMECANGEFEFLIPEIEDAKLILESEDSVYELELSIDA